jgi:hypothetical protein
LARRHVASALAPKEVTGLEYFSSSAVRELITLFCSIPMLFEIDGATQVWHSSARYAQFRAPAFPSSLPCRSRCRALAGLARAQTSDDIRPRALCTPPPKSFARSPGPCIQPMLPRGSRCGQHLSRLEHTSGPIVTFAPQHTLRALRVRTLCADRPPAGFRVISKARSTSPATEKGRGIGCRALRPPRK